MGSLPSLTWECMFPRISLNCAAAYVMLHRLRCLVLINISFALPITISSRCHVYPFKWALGYIHHMVSRKMHKRREMALVTRSKILMYWLSAHIFYRIMCDGSPTTRIKHIIVQIFKNWNLTIPSNHRLIMILISDQYSMNFVSPKK